MHVRGSFKNLYSSLTFQESSPYNLLHVLSHYNVIVQKMKVCTGNFETKLISILLESLCFYATMTRKGQGEICLQ